MLSTNPRSCPLDMTFVEQKEHVVVIFPVIQRSLSRFPSVLHAGFHLINFLHPALQVLSNCCVNNLRTVTITVGLVYTYTLELLLSLSRTMPPAFLSIMSMELKILTFIILKSYFIYFNIQFYSTSYINGLIFSISQTLLIFLLIFSHFLSATKPKK